MPRHLTLAARNLATNVAGGNGARGPRITLAGLRVVKALAPTTSHALKDREPFGIRECLKHDNQVIHASIILANLRKCCCYRQWRCAGLISGISTNLFKSFEELVGSTSGMLMSHADVFVNGCPKECSEHRSNQVEPVVGQRSTAREDCGTE